MFPNRVPMDRDTPSPEPLVCSFIYSYMSAGVPAKEPHADGRPTYNRVRPGSPRGLLMTLLSLPQFHATFGTMPSTLAWVDQSPVSQRVL